MYVQHVCRFAELTRWSDDWSRLAGANPFVSWNWLSHWWQHFGQDHELYTLVVLDQHHNVVGIAPWYIERSPAKGRRIKFLGSGQVCSDYLRLLVASDQMPAVIDALAEWLTDANSFGEGRKWDFISLEGVVVNEPSLQQLGARLVAAGCLLDEEPSLDCWRLNLPDDYETYHRGLTKNTRRKLRVVMRDYLETDRARLRFAETERDFEAYYDAFVDLHQRRRVSLGEAGCFALPQFRGFLQNVSRALFQNGQLLLSQLRIDDQIAAASLGILASDAHYMYQTGMNPQLQRHQPGWLMNLLNIRYAIAHGIRAIDYLRGDEPYKARLGACRIAMSKSHIVANHVSARMRNHLWRARTAARGRGFSAFALAWTETDAGGERTPT